MPYVALQGTKRVYLAKHEREHIETKLKPQGFAYCCPACSAPMRIVSGECTTPHFRHKAGCECTHEGQPVSLEHLQAQMMLDDYLTQNMRLRHVLLEAPIDMPWRPKGRIADVLVGDVEGARVVFEVQLSPISVASMRERTNDYLQAGISHVVWLVGEKLRADKFRERLGESIDPTRLTIASLEILFSSDGAVRTSMWTRVLDTLVEAWFAQDHLSIKDVAHRLFIDEHMEHILALRRNPKLLHDRPELLILADLDILERRIRLSMDKQRDKHLELQHNIMLQYREVVRKNEELEESHERLPKVLKELEHTQARLNKALEGAPRGAGLFPPRWEAGRYVMDVVQCRRESANGYQLEYVAVSWFPKYHVEYDDEQLVVRIPHWLALDRGLIRS